MTEAEFITLVTSPYERRSLEFKPGGPRQGYLFAQVARAALGMANLSDGGIIIVGVEEQNRIFTPVGISDNDLATWHYDDVAGALSGYADPAIIFDLETHEYQGKKYLVIQVYEFDIAPIICKKDYTEPITNKRVLQAGLCYVRGRRQAQTLPIPTVVEMRELIDFATEKGVRRFVAQARSAQIDLSGPPLPSDADSFSQQLRSLEEDGL